MIEDINIANVISSAFLMLAFCYTGYYLGYRAGIKKQRREKNLSIYGKYFNNIDSDPILVDYYKNAQFFDEFDKKAKR